MNLGPVTTPEDSFAIMDRALEHGINFSDTADVCGWKQGEAIVIERHWDGIAAYCHPENKV